MVQVIEESPSFGQIMGRGLGQLGGTYLGNKLKQMQESKQAKAFQEQFGFDPRTLGPEGIQVFAKKLGEARGGMEILKSLKGAGVQSNRGQSGAIGAQSSTGEISPEQREMVPFISPQYERYLESQEKIQSREKLAQRNEAFSETKDYRTHVSDQARAAEELDPVLDQMEHLIKRGKLTNPVVAKLSEKFGLIGLLDPSSQQFQGLSIGFLNNAKNVFGARLTNLDVQTYLDKIPRIVQTNAGKQGLIDNFRTLGEAAKVRNRAKNKIIKENGGIPPLDLEERVSEKANPELDKLFDKFNKSFYESSKTASGKILMRHPNGTLGEVPEDKVKEATEKGYKLQ